MTLARILALAIALAFLGCGTSAPTPGYDGDVPSPSGQRVLAELKGKTLPAELAPDGKDHWSIGVFAVVPNGVSPGGKGPVVLLHRPDGEVAYHIVNDDGEVAALFEKVAGEPHATLGK